MLCLILGLLALIALPGVCCALVRPPRCPESDDAIAAADFAQARREAAAKLQR